MRWHASPSGFDGSLAAVPVTLLSREEDAHHPAHHHHYNRPPNAIPPTVLSRRSLPPKPAFRASASSPIAASRPTEPLPFKQSSIATPSETIRLSSTVIATPRAVVDRELPATTARVLTPRDGDIQFLVCAGQALSSDTPRNNNDEDATGEGSCAQRPPPLVLPPSLHTTSPSTLNETPRMHRGLQRSDSELELIINELREKISRQQSHQQRALAASRAEEDGLTTNTSTTNQHSRKHLKNPVEKMAMAPSSSSSNLQIRCQASASQVAATRLVGEGSAAMVKPVVLSSSASRAGLFGGGGGLTAPSTSHHQHVVRDAKELTSVASTDASTADGLRIRSYPGGFASSAGHAYGANPHFTSSTSLGLPLPSHHSAPLRASSLDPADASPPLSSLIQQSIKPRMRTLADFDLELDRLSYANSDEDRHAGAHSPVGPWLIDHDTDLPLASSRSSSSLTSTSSSSPTLQLATTPSTPPPATIELSPRSRLLWLSDCCSDDAWGATSTRVMALLRPGSCKVSGASRRPASAVESHRREGKPKLTADTTPGKPRAASAKPAAVARRSSSGSVPSQELSGPKPATKVQRPRSGTGSSSTSTSNNRGNASCAIALRPSYLR